MHILWGILMIIAGLFLLVGGSLISVNSCSLEDTMGREYISFSPNCRSNCHRFWSNSGSWAYLIGIFHLVMTCPQKTDDLIYLKELIEAGKIKSVIDRRYPLEQMAEAHRYVEKGHKKGNVVITVEHSDRT